MKVIPDKSHEYHYSPYPPPPPPPAGGLASGSSSPNSFAPPPVSRKGSKKDKVQRQQSPLNEDATTYKVARAISSCTRCRQRKQKCDGKLPACTACDRAKVECIGFDAISKTNVSRNYLHSLEQEVATLRAQIAAMSQNTDDNGASMVKREIAERASEAVQTISRPHPESGFARPSDLLIDPSLQNETGESSLRSPWDSPGFAGQFPHRRHSEFAFSSSGFDSPRSPYTPGHSTSASRTQMMGQQSGIGASSLTRLVHDAAFKTGHAQNAYTQLHALGANQTGSEKGSDYSAADTPQLDSVVPSPQDPPAGKSGQATSASTSAPSNAHFRPPTSSPLATAASVSSGKSSSAKRRHFSVPPLPPQPAVERLVAAYVDFVGVTAPIIHIPSLGKQLIKIRENRDVEQSDIFVVMMVLALSTMASSRFVDPPDELRACSEAFHAEAMKHMDAVFEEQSYVGLQAILLLVWYSLLNPEKGSIWFLIGLATRTCVDLGFHNEHNIDITHFDALELDMRRRLFWVTYKMDRLLSQALGRPPSIPDGYISVPLPSSLHDVDIHSNDFGPLTGEPCSYKAVFLHTTKLRQLQSEILDCTYGLHRPDGTLNVPPPEWFDDCFERLKEWLATSPEPRGTVSSEGYAISFHNSALLLFRPSLGCERPGRKALSTVLASSSYVIRIYRRMQLNNRISWLWMTSHWSFMAGLSFLYAFFNLYTIGGVPGVPTLEEAMADIESCMAVLEYLAPRVPSAGACHDTMQTLSKAIMEQLQSISSTTSPGARGALRSAPISSSRDDPLPNESFPAPLPAIALPYELSLLDNLFVNPMAQHNKASDYTNGNKCKKNGKKDGQDGNNASSGAYDSSSRGAYGGSHGSRGDRSMGPPQGFPPNAFGGNTLPGSASTAGGNTIGLQAYGMAAQMGSGKSSGTIAPHGAFSPSTMGLGDSSARNDTPQSYGYDSSKAGQGQRDTSALDDLAAAANGSMAMMGDGQNAGTAGAGANGAFDMFSFLMDEEGGLAGSGNWDALDIPSDFGLWS